MSGFSVIREIPNPDFHDQRSMTTSARLLQPYPIGCYMTDRLRMMNKTVPNGTC